MKITKRQLKKLINEHLYTPLTKGTYIDSIMRDPQVPQKAKDALQSAVDNDDEASIDSMIELIKGLTLNDQGESIYDIPDSEFEKKYPNKYDGDLRDSPEDYLRTFTDANSERIRIEVNSVLSNWVSKFNWYRYSMGYTGVDERGVETEEVVQVGGRRALHPYGDPYVTVTFHDLKSLREGKKELEANGFRLAPQGLPEATNARFYKGPYVSVYGEEFPNRTVVVSKSEDIPTYFLVKVKYA